MERSFGTLKEHYGLHRVKVRLKETEILMIFFGVYMGNAVILGRRLLAKEVSEEAEDLKTAGYKPSWKFSMGVLYPYITDM